MDLRTPSQLSQMTSQQPSSVSREPDYVEISTQHPSQASRHADTAGETVSGSHQASRNSFHTGTSSIPSPPHPLSRSVSQSSSTSVPRSLHLGRGKPSGPSRRRPSSRAPSIPSRAASTSSSTVSVEAASDKSLTSFPSLDSESHSIAEPSPTLPIPPTLRRLESRSSLAATVSTPGPPVTGVSSAVASAVVVTPGAAAAPRSTTMNTLANTNSSSTNVTTSRTITTSITKRDTTNSIDNEDARSNSLSDFMSGQASRLTDYVADSVVPGDGQRDQSYTPSRSSSRMSQYSQSVVAANLHDGSRSITSVGDAASTKSVSTSNRGNTHQSSVRSQSPWATARTDVQETRNSLFDDGIPVDPYRIPGALHFTDDAHIERLISRHGAVALIRQISLDLAKRDAQNTSLRRQADTREQALRRVCLDTGMSNLELEARLKSVETELEKKKRRGRSEDGLESLMNDAMSDTMVHTDAESVTGSYGSTFNSTVDQCGDATIRATRPQQGASVNHTSTSVPTTTSSSTHTRQGDSNGKSRGWKEFFWGGSKTSHKNGLPNHLHDHKSDSTHHHQKRGNQHGEGDHGYDESTILRSATTRLASQSQSYQQQQRRPALQSNSFQPPTPTARSGSPSLSSANSRSNSQNRIASGISSGSRSLSRRASSITSSITGSLSVSSNSGSDVSKKQETSLASLALRLVVGGGGMESQDGSPSANVATLSLPQHQNPRTEFSEATNASSTKHQRSLATTHSPSMMNLRSLIRMGNSSPGSSTPSSPLPSTGDGTTKTGPQSRNPTDSGRASQVPESRKTRESSSTKLASRTDGRDTFVTSNTATTLGPVEMDTIHPTEIQPPTLTSQIYNQYQADEEFLTDRFGFIYDQRRKFRQRGVSQSLQGVSSEHLATQAGDEEKRSASMNGGKGKSWQEYLRIATIPTELLSHTPLPAAPSTQIASGDDADADHRESSHANNDSSDHHSPHSSREPSSRPKQDRDRGDDGEAIKRVLEHVNEVHDSLQRDKTILWNEFLRKVRAERRREGEMAVASARAVADARYETPAVFLPEAQFTDGEMIGISDLGNKGKVGRAKWNEFKALVIGGIPMAFRCKVWAECSGATVLRVPGQYEELVKRPSRCRVDDVDRKAKSTDDDVDRDGVRGTEDQRADPPSSAVITQIDMDIHRTLTDNIFFRKGPGVGKLKDVLLAYAHRNPEVGYCQGMNLIAANLLLIMPTAADAFWVFVSIIENILPPKYYDHSLLASRADQQVLRQYVREILPRLSQHLDALNIELEALTFQWFLTVFTDCLSAEALFRVWDVMLCTQDGSTFLFQVALALLKLNEASLLQCDTPAAVYTYINHQMTNHAISIDGLIHASDGLKRVVKREDIDRRRQKAVQVEMERENQRRRQK